MFYRWREEWTMIDWTLTATLLVVLAAVPLAPTTFYVTDPALDQDR